MAAVAEVVIYSTRHCGYCQRAKSLLARNAIEFAEVFVDVDQAQRERMEQRSGRRSVPQIFIGERHVGGYEELYALERSGELVTLAGAAG